ncbi:MAG: hypothetical protein HYT67_01270 [Candidatus Yanofskybacteria bacterium]|nr:hypothetical protein [Candidatus Yanofskybacteria bacterium]
MKIYDIQKGSVLIFSVLMLGVILTITLSLANTLLPRLKSAQDSLSSVAAIYAADSAVEWCLYTQRDRQPPVSQPVMSNGATYTILFGAGPGTCAPAESPLNHTVIGTFRTVTRAFKVEE